MSECLNVPHNSMNFVFAFESLMDCVLVRKRRRRIWSGKYSAPEIFAETFFLFMHLSKSFARTYFFPFPYMLRLLALLKDASYVFYSMTRIPSLGIFWHHLTCLLFMDDFLMGVSLRIESKYSLRKDSKRIWWNVILKFGFYIIY